MLQINALDKYIDNKLIINSATLTVSRGSIHGLIGNNGAGKTTLFKTIMGIYKPDAGSITWKGDEIHENPDCKCNLYMIPDQLVFRASETVKTLANMHRALYPNWSQECFESLMRTADIDINTNLKPLSKGRQRLCLFCIALATKADLLLLDEPFDGLDPVIRKLVKRYLIDEVAKRELSVFISSHNLNELEDLCDTVTLIHQSEIKHTNELDDLKSNLHKVQIQFKEDHDLDLSLLNILTHKKTNLLELLIVRGSALEIEKTIKSLRPVFYEVIPITLEELFIYEMEGYRYEFKESIQ